MERIFVIFGRDGKEYPDVPEERVRLWRRQGRIDGATQVREGDGPWVPLDQALPPQAGAAAFCLNHPDRPAVATCSQCAESFCAECVDAPGAFAACLQCRPAGAARPESSVPVDTEATELASQALTYALVSIICFGLFLAPVALYKAVKARQLAAEEDRPSNGMGKATGALWVGGVVLALNLLILFGRIAAAAR